MRDQKLVYTSEDGESKEIDIPSWLGEAPVNHHHLREAFALAMGAEGIDQETIAEIVQTVDDGVVSNENHLVWEKGSEEGSSPGSD
jgi:hypothetical protein